MTPLERFRSLALPTDGSAFRLGGEVCRGCSLAVAADGSLSLLIAVVPTGTSTARHLENLRYDPPSELEVFSSHGRRREILASLVCRTSDEALQTAFLRIGTALLDTSATKLTEAELEDRLDDLVALFRALGRPANQTIQGLWAELAIVAWATNPRVALASWHSSPRALHDFASGPDRLEVKSTSTGLREHALRLEQLGEAPGGRTFLASIMVQETEDGTSVEDLCALVLARVEADIELRRRLETIVTQSLGRDWREAATRRFDVVQARGSLRFYEAERVPCVAQPLPPEVKHVSFVVDLSTTDGSSHGDVRRVSSFFAATIPRDPPEDR